MEFNDPQLFINRELSWLAFNERVLDDARSRELPLYERLKFFAIASSNLDEFFMVRVAGLKQQLASGVAEPAADGLLPAEQLSAISERVHALVDSASRLWVEELHPGLLAAGVSVLTRDKLTAEQKAAARTFFTTSVFPALTPLAVDPGHPFPHLRNKSLNVAVLLRREGPRRRRNVHGTSLAVVQVPSVLSRLVPMPAETVGLAWSQMPKPMRAAYRLWWKRAYEWRWGRRPSGLHDDRVPGRHTSVLQHPGVHAADAALPVMVHA